MLIFRARPEDAAALTDIAFAAKRNWGYRERWIESWRGALTISPEFICQHESFIALTENQHAGFYALGEIESGLELLHLWVRPHFMRQGIGRALFTHALERVARLGFRTLEIESDPNAEGFYLHMGAHRIGTRTKTVESDQRALPVLVYKMAPNNSN